MPRSLLLCLVLVLALSLAACDALSTDTILERITAPNDSSLPDSVKAHYQEDAAQLAMRRIQRIQPGERQAVTLPPDLVQLYYDALVHVHQADDVTGRDAIGGLHAFPRYPTHEAVVAIDTTVAWTEAWRQGRRLTGRAEVDQLLEVHDLSVTYQDGRQPRVVVRSEPPINTVALVQRFEAIPGVAYAELNMYGGDGNDIRAALGEDAMRLTYSRGWGDCPAGCIHRASWTYRVEKDGTVQFVNHEKS